jgi:hypothetical protein
MQAELPKKFLLRVMRRCREMKGGEQDDEDEAERCYYEHTTDEEKASCPKKHMRYDEKKEHAYFE